MSGGGKHASSGAQASRSTGGAGTQAATSSKVACVCAVNTACLKESSCDATPSAQRTMPQAAHHTAFCAGSDCTELSFQNAVFSYAACFITWVIVERIY